MKVSGRPTKDTVAATKCLQMETCTTAVTRKGKLTEKVFISGKTGKSMMENGSWVSSMATEFGEESTAKVTLVSGTRGKHKDTGCMFGAMETSMRGSGSVV